MAIDVVSSFAVNFLESKASLCRSSSSFWYLNKDKTSIPLKA